jgi:hypothetical protein
MNRYPTIVKTIPHAHPNNDRGQSRVAFLLLLLMAAFGLVYWLQTSAPGVRAEGISPISPLTCFLAANIPSDESTQGGILLAWRTAITDTTTVKFELARAKYVSKDSNSPVERIPESKLPDLQNKEITENLGEWRYTVLDKGVGDDIKYAYVLTATETISLSILSVLTETRVYSSASITYVNNEICLQGSTVTPAPTETPLPTITPTPTWTDIPTNTPLPPTPTHTATPTWTPTPTNTQPPSPLVFPTDTPFPSPTFTPLPTSTPLPPTPTVTPTFTPSPTFTPAISAPTPRFDANTNPNSQSILPTPEWTPTPESQSALSTETPTPTPSETPTPEPMMADNASAQIDEEAIPAQTEFMASSSMMSAEAEDTRLQAAPLASDPPQVRSEFSAAPTRDGSSMLRLALYAVGALAAISALAFLLGALALFGRRTTDDG